MNLPNMAVHPASDTVDDCMKENRSAPRHHFGYELFGPQHPPSTTNFWLQDYDRFSVHTLYSEYRANATSSFFTIKLDPFGPLAHERRHLTTTAFEPKLKRLGGTAEGNLHLDIPMWRLETVETE
ncbi:hypothetical protein [Burkholderia latens]|uniref:hypothetical protein n=1 Tax=Burkholderia latens TaxID=488446 RepID=UPI0012E3E4C7|nr:hypothetical protein [Burkholderia latens]